MSTIGLTPSADFVPREASAVPDVHMRALGRTEGPASTQPAGDSFATMLGNLVSEVNARQNLAAEAVSALQSGQNVSLHQAVLAMEEASISFQLMVEVRNKLLESYQELMRMQI